LTRPPKKGFSLKSASSKMSGRAPKYPCMTRTVLLEVVFAGVDHLDGRKFEAR
jgi:hypothetical protein